MQHVMVDLETLGRKPGCIILSIGAVAFDPIKGELGREFYTSIDAEQQQFMGMTMDAGTVLWWMKQSDAAREAAITSERSLVSALNGFDDFWRGCGYIGVDPYAAEFIWAHGAPFDPPILEGAYQKCGRKIPWDFRNVRDTRTIYHLAKVVVPRDAHTHHHALADARAQAIAVCNAYKILGIKS